MSTAQRIEAVLDVKDTYLKMLVDARTRGIARDIADYMVSSPFATLSQIAAHFGKPYQSVKDAVEKLISLEIVEDVPGTTQRVIRAPRVLAAYRT